MALGLNLCLPQSTAFTKCHFGKVDLGALGSFHALCARLIRDIAPLALHLNL